MTFANLWAFWFSLVALPIFVLYLFRVRRRRQDVPHLAIWRKILQERRTTFLLKRLRRVLSLLLQLAIMILLMLALSRPVISAFFTRAAHVVLVIDRSASMQAVEGTAPSATTRFARAVEAAERHVRSKPDATEVMLLAADRDLSIICPFTSDARLLVERLRQTRATPFPADLARACALAAEVVGDRGGGRVVLFSDGTGPTAKALRDVVNRAAQGRAGDVAFASVTVGGTDDNVGIVNFAARKNEVLKTDEVLVAVGNFSSEEKRVSVEYYEGETLRKVLPLTLPPGEEAERTFSTALPRGAVLRAHLPGGDAFALDDTAFAVVRPEKRYRVLLVAGEDDRFFYVKAFNAMEESVNEESLVLTPAEYRANAAARAGGFDLAVFVRCAPPSDLPSGTYVFVDCDAPSTPRRVGRLGPQRISEWDRAHPINRYVTYHDVVVREARAVTPDAGAAGADASILARSAQAPLVLLRETGTHRTVYIQFDVQKTDLPLRVAFPAMLRNILTWSHRRAAEPFRARYATGETIRPRTPFLGDDVKEATITFLVGGEEDERRVPLDERGMFSFADTDVVAPCRIDVGERRFFTGVSLLARSESAIAPSPTEADAGDRASPEEAGMLRSLFSSARFWQLLLALASVGIVIEWLLFHRRVTE